MFSKRLLNSLKGTWFRGPHPGGTYKTTLFDDWVQGLGDGVKMYAQRHLQNEDDKVVGEHTNQYSFAGVLQTCSNLDIDQIGEVIFGFVMKTGYLIDPFVKGRGDLSFAQKVFDKMSERNSAVWTLIFTRYAQLGHPRVAVALFMEIPESGHMPDRYTFSTVVSAGSELELLSLGEKLHSQVIKSRLASDVCVGCSLVDMYAKCAGDGSMANSRKVFDVLADHTVMFWTSIITGYVQSGGCDKEAIELYYRMTEGNSLISIYARCRNIEAASKVFATMEDRNVVSWTSIITGLVSRSMQTPGWQQE